MKDDRLKDAVDRLNKEEDRRVMWREVRGIILLIGIIVLVALLILKYM